MQSFKLFVNFLAYRFCAGTEQILTIVTTRARLDRPGEKLDKEVV